MSRNAVEAVQLSIEDLRSVLDTLDESEWAAPSGCPGWRTQDVVAHLASSFRSIVEPPPTVDPPPDLKAEQLMELLVKPRKRWSPGQVREEFENFADAAITALRAMQAEPIASAPFTLAELGTYSTHHIADALAFDLYCHLRSDILTPRGSVDRTAPPADGARLGPVIGWMLLGLPQMCQHTLTFIDRPITLELDGPGGGAWTILPTEPLLEVRRGAIDPAVTAQSTSEAFVEWATRRVSWRNRLTLQGDENYGARFCDALDII